jgi:hypothetical protein
MSPISQRDDTMITEGKLQSNPFRKSFHFENGVDKTTHNQSHLRRRPTSLKNTKHEACSPSPFAIRIRNEAPQSTNPSFFQQNKKRE